MGGTGVSVGQTGRTGGMVGVQVSEGKTNVLVGDAVLVGVLVVVPVDVLLGVDVMVGVSLGKSTTTHWLCCATRAPPFASCPLTIKL